MKIKVRVHIGIIVLLTCLISCKMYIKPLDPVTYVRKDTIIEGRHTGNYQCKYFFVENFARSKQNIDSIKKFAFQQVPQDVAQHNHFEIVFYKKTRTLNEDFRDTDEDQLAWHGNDMLFDFTWFNGKFLSFREYEDGKCKNCDAVQDIQLIKPSGQQQ